MPKVTFVQSGGLQVELEIPIGTSVMRAASSHGIDGIVGDCGGGLTCATCHVLVAKEFLDKTPTISPNEDQMLDFTAMGRRPNSRLRCQLVMTEELDGLVVPWQGAGAAESTRADTRALRRANVTSPRARTYPDRLCAI